MGLISSLIAGILSRVVYDEAAAWSPNLSRMLLKLAVNSMPKLQRDRCREEWQAWIDEFPGHVSKIAAAFGFLIVAQRVNFCNVWAASRALLETRQYERTFLAGYLSACQAIIAKFELAQPVGLVGSADTVPLYYIMRMRGGGVLNIAHGNDPNAGIGKIVCRALQIDMESFALGLIKDRQSSTTQQDKEHQ